MSDQDNGAPAPSTSLTLVPKSAVAVPAHTLDPRDSEGARAGSHVRVERAQLFDLITELKKLAPCHKDPHRYHERKDELVSRLYHMATAS